MVERREGVFGAERGAAAVCVDERAAFAPLSCLTDHFGRIYARGRDSEINLIITDSLKVRRVRSHPADFAERKVRNRP